MPENLDYSLYFNIFFLVIIGLGILIGFLRGFKKSFYSLIVMILFYVLFFLTVDIASKQLWVMHIPFVGDLLANFYPELADTTSLQQALPIVLDRYLGDNLAATLSNEEFLIFMESLSLLVVKIIYAVIYFTIFRLIFKFIFFLIRIIFFKSKEDEEKPKHRTMGASVGLLRGCLSVFVFMIFIGGLMNITSNALSLVPEDEANDIRPYKKLVNAYNENIFVQAVDFVRVNDGTEGGTAVNHYLFDSVFSFQYRGVHISPRKELEIAVVINDLYIHSTFKQTDNVSDISGDDIREAFNLLSESDLFTAVIPLGIEVASDHYNKELSISKEELYSINWDSEIVKLGEVTAVTFDLLNSAGLIDGNTSDTVTFDGDEIRGLFNSLSDSKVATISAYTALVPVLEKASADVKAIITVPEDIVWEDEFRAIGLVAGEIADTNITIGNLESKNTSVILSALSNVDFTVILNSKIMTRALSNIITGKSNINDFDVFVVPTAVVDQDGNIVEDELRNILIAVNEISNAASDIDFTQLNLDAISKISDEAIELVFESEVFVATVSDLILEMDLGTTPLIIPDSIYDSNQYIDKVELKALAKSARIVYTTLACDNGAICENGFDIAKAFDLSDMDINTLLSSQIIESTIGNLIIQEAGTVLTIPNKALKPIQVNGVSKNIVSGTEIKNMFRAIHALGFTDIDNMSFNASIIKNLALDGQPTVLDTVEANKLYDSVIIHATVSQMLFDLDDADSSVLVIPNQDYYQTRTIRNFDEEVEYIDTIELNELLEAVLLINIVDFNEIETLDMDKIITHSSSLLDSAIIHATLSKQVLNLGNNGNIITIPKFDENNNPIIKIVGSVEYIDDMELTYLFDALKILGKTDINNFDGYFSLNLLADSQVQSDLLRSATIQATISSRLLDLSDTDLSDGLNNGVLYVPMYSQVGELEQNRIIRPIDQGDGNNINYVDKTEIGYLIDAFISMGFTDLESQTYGSSLSSSLFFTNRDYLLRSSTIQATLSQKMLEIGTDYLLIPNSVRISQTDVTYIEINEMKFILNGLEDLNLTDFNTVQITSISVFDDNVNIVDLLNSQSIQATISNIILSNPTVYSEQTAFSGSTYLIVPTTLREDTLVDTTTYEQIQKDELIDLLTALDTLGSDFNGNMNPSTITSMSGNLDTLLNSGSIHMTFDNMLKGNTFIDVPELAKDYYYDLATKLVTIEELKAFIVAADTLNMDFTIISFSASAIVGLTDTERNTVVNSMIVRDSITEDLEAFISIDPDFSIDSTYYHNNDTSTFFTYLKMIEVLDHIKTCPNAALLN